MRYDIVLAPEALKAFGNLPAYNQAEARDIIERHLPYEPARIRKSRIKHLQGLAQPQYRLRIGEVRVFYDVTSQTVKILAIVTKAGTWLAEHGTPTPGSSDGGEG